MSTSLKRPHLLPGTGWTIYSVLQHVLSCVVTTEWVLERQQHNRFVMSPPQVSKLGRELNNLSLAAAEINECGSEVGLDAAKDLVVLSDFMYRAYLRDRGYSWA